VSDVYAAIEAIAQDTSVPTVTIRDVLEVSRSAYYDWLTRKPGTRERELDELTPAIVEIFVRHRRRYGARRIASELGDEDTVCSARRVAGVLKNQVLRAIQPRSFVPRTTDSRHTPGYRPNLLLDADEPTRVDELWVGDITYLPLRGGGFGYLAALLDRYSRDIVAWSIDATMTVDRNRVLAAFGFDPARDIRIGPSGCWEWASRKPELHRWAREYFYFRREDGSEKPSTASGELTWDSSVG